jgi:hypothetical protein
MKSLAEYEQEVREANPLSPELSGIQCPECKDELKWAERSLICKNPPMQRLVCDCGFTKVVPVRA